MRTKKMLDLSQYGPKSFPGRALRLPLRAIPKGIVARVVQGPARGFRWVVGSGTHGHWIGIYESDKVRAFASSLASGDVVYDIGAHAGYYTLIASRLVGPTGRVIAFEPNPENARALRRHIALNHIRNVEMVVAAVGHTTGSARFHAAEGSTYTGGLSSGGNLEVPSVALDEATNSGDLPTPQVIKMDIEGGESLAIAGARDLLLSARPVIFLATHGEVVREEVESLLGELEYDMVPLVPTRDGSECSEWLCRPRPQPKRFSRANGPNG